MRGGAFVLLLLLAACGHTASTLSAQQPGVAVAQAALRGGSPQTALQVVAGVLQSDPGNEAALVLQGDALTELGQLEQARISYAQALRRNPQSVGALIGLARLHLTDDPAAAEAEFLKALQYDPRDTTAWTDLGVARDLRGHHDQAQDAYRHALGIDPEDNAAQVNLALSMAMSGSADAGVRMLRPLAEGPGASRKLRHDLAAALTMAGDRDEAARILSADLSPAQVRQALEAYAAARNGGTSLAASAPSGAAATAPAADGALAARGAPVAGVQVQFAAVGSEAEAQATWHSLQERMPQLLAGRQPMFTRIERDGHVFWRVRTGGFASGSLADGFCQQVRHAGAACAVAGP
jgi:Flp pilus assembly protein TadD